MQSVTDFVSWLQALPLAAYVHRTKWAFTTIQLLHAGAVSVVVGSIALVDLRLAGLAFRRRPFTELARALLPWTWAAFVVAVLAGSLLFISQASDYFTNTLFRLKMLALLLAGINMLIFETMTVRGVQKWDLAPAPPFQARLAGIVSLVCWATIIVLGRWVSFSVTPE